MKFPVLIVLSALSVTACGSILPKGGPAPRLYTLNAVHWTQDQTIAPIPVSLKIIKPQIAAGLDTERIAVRQGPNQLDYYANVRWASDAPSLIQTALTDNFTATHRLKAVSNDLVPLKSDYQLLVNVTDFQVQDGQARVAFDAKLVRAVDDEVIKTSTYAEQQAVANNDMRIIAQAFDKAQQRACEKVVKDILAILRQEPPIATPSQTVTTVTKTSVE